MASMTAERTNRAVNPIPPNASVTAGQHQALEAVFQDPHSSLDPRMKVVDLVGEGLAVQGDVSRREREEKVAELLGVVGLRADHLHRYPHEFSGGQRQRIGIARALMLRPKLVIADEAVSALDVSVRAQVLNLLADLQRDFGLTYLFISHDLSVVEYISDRVRRDVPRADRRARAGYRAVRRSADAVYAGAAVGYPGPRRGRTAADRAERRRAEPD